MIVSRTGSVSRSKFFKVNDIKFIKIGNNGADFDYYRKKYEPKQCFYIDFKNAEIKRQSFVAPNEATCSIVVEIIEKLRLLIFRFTEGLSLNLF